MKFERNLINLKNSTKTAITKNMNNSMKSFVKSRIKDDNDLHLEQIELDVSSRINGKEMLFFKQGLIETSNWIKQED